jgi:peptidoglycan/LPS O-acetylase OafA/YrhL
VSTAASQRFAHQPALDGVRGAAVAMVLLFHQGWLSGGYVGVSVFFTLSGYLITSLALVEHDATRRLDVPSFYGRRVRRLLPASLACLLGVALLAWMGVFDDVEHLRRDMWAALLQVYNWVALGDGQSYAQMVGTGTPSPLDHYWSLAIEEQFYWVWPLALVVILRRPHRGRLLLVGALFALAIIAAPVIAATAGPDAAYWATPARLGELLAGALLAVVLHRRPTLPPVASGLAGAGAALVVLAALTWPSASGPAYSGWLPVFALATCALIAGLQVASPLRSWLTWRPLVDLGIISYGVYLFHWPVFVVLDEARLGLPAPLLFVVRVAVTLVLAIASYRVLERPIRTIPAGARATATMAGAACAAVGLVLVLVPVAGRPYWMVDEAAAASPTFDEIAAPATTSATSATSATSTTATAGVPSPTSTPAPTTPQPTAPPPTATAAVAIPETPPPTTMAIPVAPPLPDQIARPVRLMVVGDSTAMATSNGLSTWAKLHPSYLRVSSAAGVGCGMVADGDAAAGGRIARECAKVRARLPTRQASARPDVVLGLVTLGDISDHTWDQAEGSMSPADPRYFERLVEAYEIRTTAFLDGGAKRVLWVAPPLPTVPEPADDAEVMPRADRLAHYVEVLHTIAARHPDQVQVVDLPAWLAAQPEQPSRPDGLHWSRAGSQQLAEDLLGPLVVAAGS